MKIVDIKTGKLLYGKKGKTYKVTGAFWKALLAGKVRYRTGDATKDMDITIINILSVNDPDFEKTFELIATTIYGEAVMTGKLPPDTLM